MDADKAVAPAEATPTNPVRTPDESATHEPQPDGNGQCHSGCLCRPIQDIQRTAVTPDRAQTELEAYKLSLRKYAPVQKGRDALPWKCESHCVKCDATVTSQFTYEAGEDAVYLEFYCPTCGVYRERHADSLFVRQLPPGPERQPETTHAGFPIRPVMRDLPRTVETLCPECSCLLLGRYYVQDNAVWIEKTCPEHGYFRDKINSDLRLYRQATTRLFEDERGVYEPQVNEGRHCPSDCGLCNQHHSTTCLGQIDMSNRCNLTCPVCFASANQAGYVAEPTYDMVVEMLQALRNLEPYPATAVQFTGGEPTIHPQFIPLVKKANEMGFSHVQAATNGIALANREFAERAADAGLHTLYLQFDGVDDAIYRKLRAEPLLEKKLACIENCHQTGMKVCLVPTIVKSFNEDQVGKIFQFAVDNIEAVSAISYQPVAFTGRIKRSELEQKRYTLGDLAQDLAAVSGADLERDFFPLALLTPMSRIMQLLDGKPKIRPSCHSDCAFGTYYFVTPEREAIPIPKLFDVWRLFGGMNKLAHRISAKRELATGGDKLRLAWQFLKSYRWSKFDWRVGPHTFIRALLGLTDKHYGRGQGERKSYKTLMAAGMHFMDRYNYDTERIRRCVILYSTPDGIYPFCTINGGPTFRPYIERMIACSNDEWTEQHPDVPLRPSSHPNAMMPWSGRQGEPPDPDEAWIGGVEYAKHLEMLKRQGGNGHRCKDRPDSSGCDCS